MDFPDFYHPERVGQLYVPDSATAILAGRSLGIHPASEAKVRTILVLVDMQVDFVHTNGALSVPGAVDDTRRVIEWIFHNLAHLTTIAASLDSHVPMSIFFPTWWVGSDNQHPKPYTVIRSADVKAGIWTPLYEPKWSAEYCEQLEGLSRKELMIWPYHTLIGTPGHALTPALYEAIAYHSGARQSQPLFLEKGTIPTTEYYSMLEPEVKVPDHEMGNLNVSFLDMLAGYQRIYIAGEAKSHCVLETVRSIMHYFKDSPPMIDKIRILQDGMSSVVHPTIDFDGLANKMFTRFAAQGLHLVNSSEPIRG